MILFSSLIAEHALADKLSILTTEEPPMNFMDGKVVSGFSTEIIQELQKRTKTQGKTLLLPWSRTYKMGVEKPNTIIFTMARTEKREKLFHWVGPLVGKRWILFTKKGSKIKINSLEDAKKYTIAILRGDARASFLKEKGFKHIKEVNSHLQAFKMVISGRIDLWASSDFEAPIITANAKHKFDDLKTVFTLKKIQSYAGFSKKTPLATAKRWQKAFADMKQDGSLIRIGKKWSKSLGLPITGKNGLITFNDY